jgi:hypothetical protein
MASRGILFRAQMPQIKVQKVRRRTRNTFLELHPMIFSIMQMPQNIPPHPFLLPPGEKGHNAAISAPLSPFFLYGE